MLVLVRPIRMRTPRRGRAVPSLASAVSAALVLSACASSTAPSASQTQAAPTDYATAASTAPPATSQPTPPPSSEPTPPPTAEPSTGSWATTPGRPLLVGWAIRPTVDRLNLRERPWLGAKILGVATPRDVLQVLGPPYAADGYIWHDVVFVSANGRLPDLPQHLGGAGEPASGWVAVRSADAYYIERVELRCPDTFDIRHVSAMLGGERMACFGSEAIEVEGVWEGCHCRAEPGTWTPGWLADPSQGGNLARDPTEGINALSLRFAPEGPAEPELRAIVRVQGHFDDLRADACEMAIPYPWDFNVPDAAHPIDAASATMLCRQAFVVDDYQVIGTYAGEWPFDD